MPGDLVLKKLLPARKNPKHGKLGPNWEARHSANASATVLSSALRPIRAPGKHEGIAESEIFNDLA